ncbi:MAG: hypothetical protein U9O06_10350 [Euryarchaeota archaeon]|nr:hypothetical protein [Euryarchaeota archaeon]
MSRIGTILLAVALVSALVAVPLGVSAAATAQIETNESEQVAPGERLAGVVGIQEAAVSGDLSERRYEARLDRANTDAERAAIVADRRDEIDRRLADHTAELAELRAAREAGNITEGTYRARVATLAAEKGSTERAAERASETARQLPAAALDARGLSIEDLQELRANASDLGGPETAAIAREIGGPNASTPAVGPRRDDPAASAPDRNASDRPGTTEDRQPGRSGARTVDGTNRSTGSSDADGTAGAEESHPRQGNPDGSGQQNTANRNGPAEPTDRAENAPPDAGQRSKAQ